MHQRYNNRVKKNQRHTTNEKPNMYRDIDNNNQYFNISINVTLWACLLVKVKVPENPYLFSYHTGILLLLFLQIVCVISTSTSWRIFLACISDLSILCASLLFLINDCLHSNFFSQRTYKRKWKIRTETG